MIKIIVFAILLFASLAEARTIITPSDFTFLGGFRMPSSVIWPKGLTVRRKNGQVYLYSMSSQGATQGQLIEYQQPTTLGQSFPFPQTSLQTSYGNIFQDKIRTVVDNGAGCTPAAPCIGLASIVPDGLYWDNTDQRMYWTKVVNYNNTSSTSDTGIGYSTLNDTLHTGTGIGSWKLSPPKSQGGRSSRWGFSMCPIPAWFVSEYTGGKRLGVGFGGGVSIVSNGPPSIGPAMFAINPLSPVTDPIYDYISSPPLELISHLADEGEAIRNPAYPGRAYRQGIDLSTTDRWFESDMSKYAVWIDGVNKHGLIVFGQMGAGSTNTTVTSDVQTHTSFSVVNKGDIATGDYIRVKTDYDPTHYDFESCFVSSVSGNVITINTCRAGNNSPTASLTGMPVSGGMVFSGNWYAGGGDSTSRWWNPWYIYDPADLALVAQDPVTHPPNSVSPTFNGNVPFPLIAYPGPGSPQGQLYTNRYTILGATFDPVDAKLYIATWESGGQGNVLVYQFNDSVLYQDTTAPIIDAFNIATTATSLAVPINTFFAHDDIAVVGYLVTENSTQPTADAAPWSSVAPVTYAFASPGAKTLYAWAKDAAGNVSSAATASTNITLPESGYKFTVRGATKLSGVKP